MKLSFEQSPDTDLHARDSEHKETPRGWAETSVTVTNNPACMDVAAWLAGQGG